VTFDARITLALILAVLLEGASGLIWAGAAGARLDEVERSAALQPEMNERLARLEVQMDEAQRTLVRIERKLDAQ